MRVQLGETLELSCVAGGYPIPTVNWTRVDGLPESSKVGPNGTLIIPQLKKGDGGKYLCTAKNSMEKKTYPVSLELQFPVDSKFSRHHDSKLLVPFMKFIPNFVWSSA